ncbi:MAG: phosphoadenosine phosphosulfate reductase family protein [Candidatus Omnitrophica bacterium]|nr:phosphoadenosine phosphosulfate reductase family protein [Candidatus Omnitrophota bacterium]
MLLSKYMKKIISFSGGKDSTALLLLMIKKAIPFDEIIFCDTGMEYPEVYNHIDLIKKRLKLNITRLQSKKSFEYWLADHVKQKGKNKGKKGYGWPDHRVRWCAKSLKINVIKSYLQKYNSKENKIIEYHGITWDERSRMKKNNDGRNIEYPLCKYKYSQKDTLSLCLKNGYDWEGLYSKFSRANCYCCPLQTLNDLKMLYLSYPKLWKKMKMLDKGSWRKFRKDYTILELEGKFNGKNN